MMIYKYDEVKKELSVYDNEYLIEVIPEVENYRPELAEQVYEEYRRAVEFNDQFGVTDDNAAKIEELERNIIGVMNYSSSSSKELSKLLGDVMNIVDGNMKNISAMIKLYRNLQTQVDTLRYISYFLAFLTGLALTIAILK